MGHSTILKRGAILALFAAGCGDDPAFLPISTLCSDLAEDICDARAGGCCGSADVPACVTAETSRCNAELNTLGAENLNYDSVRAAKLRNVSRAVLDACGPTPVLAGFFEGGLADGAPCQRDAQCSGGSCANALCTAATPAPLCTPQ